MCVCVCVPGVAVLAVVCWQVETCVAVCGWAVVGGLRGVAQWCAVGVAAVSAAAKPHHAHGVIALSPGCINGIRWAAVVRAGILGFVVVAAVIAGWPACCAQWEVRGGRWWWWCCVAGAATAAVCHV